MYQEFQSFNELRRAAANEIMGHWAEKLRFPRAVNGFLESALESDSTPGFGKGAVRSIRNFLAELTHRVPHWLDLEYGCIECLGRRLQHLLTINAGNSRRCGALERHLSELFIAYGEVLHAYAKDERIEECTFSLLRLTELLSRHYAEHLKAAEKDFNQKFFRAQQEVRNTAPEFIGKILRAAQRSPETYAFMQRNLVEFLRRNEITAIYGLAMGGGGLASCIAAMARAGGFESKLPFNAPCGFLVPTRRKGTEQKFYDLNGNVLVTRPGPALPRRFSAVPALPREGKILVIDDVLTKDSRTRAAIANAFGARLGKDGAVFAAGDATRYSEGADLSLLELFLPTAAAGAGEFPAEVNREPLTA